LLLDLSTGAIKPVHRKNSQSEKGSLIIICLDGLALATRPSPSVGSFEL